MLVGWPTFRICGDQICVKAGNLRGRQRYPKLLQLSRAKTGWVCLSCPILRRLRLRERTISLDRNSLRPNDPMIPNGVR
jgi:hypothetical protein